MMGSREGIIRRNFARGLVLSGIVALVFGAAACNGPTGEAAGKRVIVLGVDGMDYGFAKELIEAGELPNFARLAESGVFRPLETSAPPLSPVAWSNFITGLDSGGHGIFDFIHRDPNTMIPYLSTSRTDSKTGEHELLRHGTPFWEVLDDVGVETTIVRVPANFPVTGSATREISGMGTPDVLGTYGIFSFYTSELFLEKKEIGGGEIYPLDLWGDVAEGSLHGPRGADGEELKYPFKVFRDAEANVAKFVVGDEVFILQPQEWSEWIPFDLGSGFSPLPVMARFYLRQLQPEIEFYASPVNFDSSSPEIPLSHPKSYSEELTKATGRFYTQGMPEDTKALSEGVLTVDEFLSQAEVAGRELVEQYEYVLDQFEDGLLFYYFGNLDLVSHMMWRVTDPTHPGYSEEVDGPYRDVILQLYKNADAVIGHTLDNIGDETTLVVMSDHGFASWRRSFHLNPWLRDNGYLVLKDPDLANDPGFYRNVDWARTRAYGLGLNGLYVNLRGREKDGIVDPADRGELVAEIAAKLEQVVDPETGELAITRVYQSEKFFKDRGYLEVGPDIVMGYAKGTRGSNESASGEILADVFTDNMDPWSGDHGMDHTTVPGVFFSSRPLKREATSLTNLAAAVLAEFGVDEFPVRK